MRPKGSADGLEYRRRCALALLKHRLSLSDIARMRGQLRDAVAQRAPRAWPRRAEGLAHSGVPHEADGGAAGLKNRHASIQTTLDRYGHLIRQLHQAEAQKFDQLVFGTQAVRPVRRLQAVRVGRPARGSKMGAVAASAGRRESKMGAENMKGLAT
jgi:hypothetical protein